MIKMLCNCHWVFQSSFLEVRDIPSYANKCKSLEGIFINSDSNSIFSFVNRKTGIFLILTSNDHDDLRFCPRLCEYSNALLQKWWNKSSITSLYNSGLGLYGKKGTYGMVTTYWSYCRGLGAVSHILWLGKLGVPPPALLTWAVPG